MQNIGNILKVLTKVRLILFKKGEPYRWKLKATEITRIIPIPKPPKSSKRRI